MFPCSSQRRGVEQDLEVRARLRHEGELEVGGLLPLERLIQHRLHVRHEFVGDELGNEVLAHDLLGAVRAVSRSDSILCSQRSGSRPRICISLLRVR
jgi:hypothetical protein